VPETEKATFHKVRLTTDRTSNRKDGHVARNIIRRNFCADKLGLKRDNKQVISSKIQKEEACLPPNSLLKWSFINERPSMIQAQ
jgi:hypothetical protein